VAVLLIAPALPASAATIASFSPQSGPVGTSVSISGHGFQGAKDVLFDNKSVGAGGYTVNSNVSITATVPSGATTGKVSVVAADDTTATSTDDFVVTSGPSVTISSFSPIFGLAGTKVTINGSNFTGATTVMVGTKADPAFTLNSDSKITATVQNGAKSGPISVTTPNGTGTSATDFTVGTAPMPPDRIVQPDQRSGGNEGDDRRHRPHGGDLGHVQRRRGPDVQGRVGHADHRDGPCHRDHRTHRGDHANGTGTSKTDFTVTSPFISSFDPMKDLGHAGDHHGREPHEREFREVQRNSGDHLHGQLGHPDHGNRRERDGHGADHGDRPAGTGTSADPFTIQHPRTISLALAKHLSHRVRSFRPTDGRVHPGGPGEDPAP
jgi:hypothetical protein